MGTMRIGAFLRQFFLRFVQELGRPGNYILALLVTLIALLAGAVAASAALTAGGAVLLTLLLGKSAYRLMNRNAERLRELPAERRDPAFVMAPDGGILAAAGVTRDFLRRHAFDNIRELIDAEAYESLISSLRCDDRTERDENSGNEPSGRPAEESGEVEAYVEALGRYYRVQYRCRHFMREVLVWFEDITERKLVDSRLARIRAFTDEVTDRVSTLVHEENSNARLAELILADGFGAVFVTRRVSAEHFVGDVYRPGNPAPDSYGPIVINSHSGVAVLLSQQQNEIVWANRESQGDLTERFLFDPQVLDAVDAPIENFVNYHGGDVSIIAFNKPGRITQADVTVMETISNTAHTVTNLIELAQEADRRFIQSINGLCAAAEFSDELTGNHILRVNKYAGVLAREVCRNDELCLRIGEVAAAHDIGKVAIPHIVKLERALTGEEWREMRMHTVYGAQILRRMHSGVGRADPRLDLAARVALHHHQQWNGEGYPGIMDENGAEVVESSSDPARYESLRPLKGEEIPVEALIVSLADKYDALRSARQYKPAYDHAKTVELLTHDSRSGATGEELFGPAIFDAFNRLHYRFDEIYREMKDPERR